MRGPYQFKRARPTLQTAEQQKGELRMAKPRRLSVLDKNLDRNVELMWESTFDCERFLYRQPSFILHLSGKGGVRVGF